MNANRWQRARQVTQVLSSALFFFLALLTFRGSASLIPLDLFLRLDPFAAFTAMLASRAAITTMLLAAAAVVFGFVFGRAFCGWLCPLGAMLDWVSPRKAGKIEPRASWRGIKYILLFAAFFAALLGNLSLLILDPITIVNRTFAGVILPIFNVILITVETALASARRRCSRFLTASSATIAARSYQLSKRFFNWAGCSRSFSSRLSD